jgi:serine protease Do
VRVVRRSLRSLTWPAATLACAVAVARAEAPPARRAASGLASLSDAIEDLAERAGPTVVQVVASGYAPAGSALLARERGGGSGVIVDPEGYVVTNAHVVEGAQRIHVMLAPPATAGRSILKPPGRTLGAVLVGADAESDLAVLKLAEQGLPALPFGDSDGLRQGQLVVAFGSPFGLSNSATLGVVSAVARQLEPDSPMVYVQTDAPINPGNSGGPLLDVEGRLVGINTLIFSRSGGSEGLGFAVPSNIVRTVYEQIRRAGRVRRGEIGARAQTLTPALARGLGLKLESGVIVSDLAPRGPAERAGLQYGDVVLSLDGKPMENARQLNVNLYAREPGSVVRLEVLRGADRLALAVPVSERAGDPENLRAMVTPERNLVRRLGLLALDLDERTAPLLPPLRGRAGVVVAAGAGPALPGEEGLMPGDVIYELNGRSVLSVAALREALGALQPGDPAALRVERQGRLLYVTVDVE